ncbi:hypothetical protein H7F30_13000 [Dermacoccus sp. PAMC28757]|uniref:hypothetical protein n=1 Tax=Dermacoccus sp. PAMC28757 TaxID=2762331 RepID=UPI00164DC56A|nr:hypothetical protein [Dermacoccus sp. PAMC28757]QNK52490.1 hypothetical protein H7F30_13000 [Dermacoccus sp. PAMC28757]
MPSQSKDVGGMSVVDEKWWRECVQRHRERLVSLDRNVFDAAVCAEESTGATGQARAWLEDVVWFVPQSGQRVAVQIARLCGEGSEVTVPWRSLAEAVGIADAAGRHIAYTQRGVEALVNADWLSVESSGKGRSATTTFRLLAGELLTPEAAPRDGENGTAESAA